LVLGLSAFGLHRRARHPHAVSISPSFFASVCVPFTRISLFSRIPGSPVLPANNPKLTGRRFCSVISPYYSDGNGFLPTDSIPSLRNPVPRHHEARCLLFVDALERPILSSPFPPVSDGLAFSADVGFLGPLRITSPQTSPFLSAAFSPLAKWFLAYLVPSPFDFSNFSSPRSTGTCLVAPFFRRPHPSTNTFCATLLYRFSFPTVGRCLSRGRGFPLISQSL